MERLGTAQELMRTDDIFNIGLAAISVAAQNLGVSEVSICGYTIKGEEIFRNDIDGRSYEAVGRGAVVIEDIRKAQPDEYNAMLALLAGAAAGTCKSDKFRLGSKWYVVENDNIYEGQIYGSDQDPAEKA